MRLIILGDYISSYIFTNIKSSPITTMFSHGITISSVRKNKENDLVVPGTIIDVIFPLFSSALTS